MSPEALTLAAVLGLLAAVAARLCGGTTVHVAWACLLIVANVLAAQTVLDRLPPTDELTEATRPAGPWSAGHAAWLLSPTVFEPLPEQVDIVDSVTGIGQLPAAVLLDARGATPISGHVPWLGWTALWLALIGLAAPGATSGIWLTRLGVLVALGASTLPSAAPYAQGVAVALLAGLAGRGLAWLDARGDEAFGAAVPMTVAGLAVALGGAAIAAATWGGIATDARVVDIVVRGSENGELIARQPLLVATAAEQMRRVLDIAAVIGALSMSVILWHLKSRSWLSRTAVVLASLAELVGAVYAFRTL